MCKWVRSRIDSQPAGLSVSGVSSPCANGGALIFVFDRCSVPVGAYLTPLEWAAQTWDVNSLSRCNSKLRIISSNDAPVGAPEGLNRQPHWEQPKPRKCCCSIHTSSRFMAASVAVPERVPACCQRTGSPLAAPLAAAHWLIAGENPLPSLGLAEDA